MWNSCCAQIHLADNNTLIGLVSLDIADWAWHPNFYLPFALAECTGALGAHVKTTARALRALFRAVYPVCTSA
jgi:hypothetical protein